MESRRYIPIKYKFLAVLFVITFMSLSVFFAFTYKTFSEDKKLFVMDLNISVLRATTSDIKLELKTRIEELQIFVPRIYQQGRSVLAATIPKDSKDADDPFQGLSPTLADELLAVTFYRQKGDGFESFQSFENRPLLTKKKVGIEALAAINQKHPLNLKDQVNSQDMGMLNRSISFSEGGRKIDLPVITFLVSGNYVDSDSKGVVIAIDLLQDFLRKKLQQSEIAEIFLIKKGGAILSHPANRTTVEYAARQYPHPIVARISGKQFPRESMELSINQELYLCNVSETGFKDIFAVSQIKKSEAFLALQTLVRKSIYLSVFVLAVALVLSILFASGLTSNIQKLQQAAELIGAGNLKVEIKINSRDEIGLVSESFQWMAGRIQELVTETAQKARMAEELETARLVQSTLLTTPIFDSKAFEIASFYTPAGECGGDLWDAWLQGKTLTLIVGDATGHGAPAAIVTAVAKACFGTLNAVFRTQTLPPEQVLEMANHVIYTACQGKLLMTMCLLQLDLETGLVTFCSAGHEPPFCMRKPLNSPAQTSDKKTKITAETLFARGERLGFGKDAKYAPEVFQLNLGDTLMVYTDGLNEARDPEMKEWGERALKKSFVKQGNIDLTTIKDYILAQMAEHIRGEPYHDDVTLVLLRWLKSSTSETSTLPEGPSILAVSSAISESGPVISEVGQTEQLVTQDVIEANAKPTPEIAVEMAPVSPDETAPAILEGNDISNFNDEFPDDLSVLPSDLKVTAADPQFEAVTEPAAATAKTTTDVTAKATQQPPPLEITGEPIPIKAVESLDSLELDPYVETIDDISGDDISGMTDISEADDTLGIDDVDQKKKVA